MTTHDRDKIIAVAKESGAYISGPVPRWIERLYAIAYEDGRQADKADAERYRWLCEQNEKGVGFFHLAFAARNIMNWKTKTEIDDGIDRARPRQPKMKKVESQCWRNTATGNCAWAAEHCDMSNEYWQRFPAGDIEGDVSE